MSPVNAEQMLSHILLVTVFVATTLVLLRIAGNILVKLRAAFGMLFSSAIAIASAGLLWLIIFLLFLMTDTPETRTTLNSFVNQANPLLMIVTALVSPFFFWTEHKVSLKTNTSDYQAGNLAMQLRPHFVFNVLNSIAHLISLQPEKAEKALYNTADIFRVVLADSRKTVTFRAELELAEKYLYLEKTRLGKRLKVISKVDPQSMDISVPVLFLQPLLEKAVYHGIETRVDGGTIKLGAQVIGNELIIQITNPLSKEHSTMDRTDSLTQNKIRQRLKGLFGEQCTFDTYETPEHYTVTIKLPL